MDSFDTILFMEKKMLFGKKQKNIRAYPRVDFFQSSYYLIENEGPSGTNECWFYNISLGGIGFESEKTDLINAIITIVYKIGSQYRKDRLKIKYSTRLISKWRYGCQFINDDDQRNKLISYYIGQRVINN
jgi:hypothetical protein